MNNITLECQKSYVRLGLLLFLAVILLMTLPGVINSYFTTSSSFYIFIALTCGILLIGIGIMVLTYFISRKITLEMSIKDGQLYILRRDSSKKVITQTTLDINEISSTRILRKYWRYYLIVAFRENGNISPEQKIPLVTSWVYDIKEKQLRAIVTFIRKNRPTTR